MLVMPCVCLTVKDSSKRRRTSECILTDFRSRDFVIDASLVGASVGGFLFSTLSLFDPQISHCRESRCGALVAASDLFVVN